MIRINCRQIVQIIAEMRRALGIVRNSMLPVVITADRSILTLRASTEHASLACQTTATVKAPSDGGVKLTLPIRAFSTIPSLARQDLTITPVSEGGILEWTTAAGIRSTISEKCISAVEPNTKPVAPQPEWLISNDSRFGKVLSQAASIADPTSTRYSLGCVRLRGSDGQVAATDGRQAYTVSGFGLPLDDVMVPAEVLSRLSFLRDCSSISVGRSADWLSLRCGIGTMRWLVDVKIQSEGRFPNIDQCMPHESSSRCLVRISDLDAQYMLRHLDKLVGKSFDLNPVTLDLSRNRVLSKPQVQLRFRGMNPNIEPSNLPITELTLDQSSYDSTPMQLAIDHHFLLNALRFGFREFHLQSISNPIFCCSRNQSYTWTTMHESLTIGPTPVMKVISTEKTLVAA
jgi:DNA polymerase III sliding clamp (beta) subunit (PCNA family)